MRQRVPKECRQKMTVSLLQTPAAESMCQKSSQGFAAPSEMNRSNDFSYHLRAFRGTMLNIRQEQ
jgi:hypothetical protein